MCCAKGDANTEKAEGILEDVANEVDSLICDPRYGFPGIELYRETHIEKKNVGQGTDLEKLRLELRKDLEDHMNLRIDELEKLSERIARESNLRGGILTLYLKTRVLGTKEMK